MNIERAKSRLNDTIHHISSFISKLNLDRELIEFECNELNWDTCIIDEMKEALEKLGIVLATCIIYKDEDEDGNLN